MTMAWGRFVGKIDELVRTDRPSRLLFGLGTGVQVWEICASAHFYCSVLTGHGSPIVMVSGRLVGTAYEAEALNWALTIIASGSRGYSALVANDRADREV